MLSRRRRRRLHLLAGTFDLDHRAALLVFADLHFDLGLLDLVDAAFDTHDMAGVTLELLRAVEPVDPPHAGFDRLPRNLLHRAEHVAVGFLAGRHAAFDGHARALHELALRAVRRVVLRKNWNGRQSTDSSQPRDVFQHATPPLGGRCMTPAVLATAGLKEKEKAGVLRPALPSADCRSADLLI